MYINKLTKQQYFNSSLNKFHIHYRSGISDLEDT
jgi:hypothetical protein